MYFVARTDECIANERAMHVFSIGRTRSRSSKNKKCIGEKLSVDLLLMPFVYFSRPSISPFAGAMAPI